MAPALNPSEEFSALPLEAVRSAALERASALGCSHAEVRVERIRSQVISLRDGVVESVADDSELGIGLRVVRSGAMGFAATIEMHPDAARELADRAVSTAEMAARAGGRKVELADEPSYGEASWESPHTIDPFIVPLAEKTALLESWSRRLLDDAGINHVRATLLAVREDKHFADLNGTITTQRRVRVHPSVEAVSIAPDGSGFETMRTVAPPAGRGYEYLLGDGWDFEGELSLIPGFLEERVAARSVTPGRYDLVVDPTNLWLTIHESVGHATELDRALGYEAAYAGTSFATFDQLGTLRYGSALMHITGDRTTPNGLATVAYDDEGVAAQSFDLVREGVLVGYQLDRTIATEAGLGRSNGCAFASSPLMTPIQRMANVSLHPSPSDGPSTDDLISSVDLGLYVVGDKSWSIDMQRHNFQFTGQRFYLIEHGRIVGQVRDAAYQAETTQFWGSLVGLGNASTYLLAGAMNCGKGQPSQVAPVSHGCPSALFSQVNVLNAREESGR